ncbi:unnamed protein product [Pleuronectes platessa]|uniref:Uncharacterized protein n=1 Tax=Pleuronectes platessa TaxID=8262 RepID=A0A9N7V462_PLEPL|nr:unnamed protein product [Pleuronectes platessa]
MRSWMDVSGGSHKPFELQGSCESSSEDTASLVFEPVWNSGEAPELHLPIGTKTTKKAPPSFSLSSPLSPSLLPFFVPLVLTILLNDFFSQRR